MGKRAIVCLIAGLISAPGMVRAEADRSAAGNEPLRLGRFKGDVGSWAEYLNVAGASGPVHVRLAFVGRQGGANWHEIRSLAGGVRNVVKLLVDGEGRGLEAVKRIIFKPGDNPALEMPAGSLGVMGGLMLLGPALGLGQAGEIPAVEDFRDLGPETVSIAVGRFDARHYHLERAEEAYDVWISDSVPLWGLVRILFPGGRFELIDSGKGAKSEIEANPQRLELPFLLQPAPKK